MRSLMESVADLLSEGNQNTLFYHGSNAKITNFNDEFVGNGNDQYGPGIYFANKPHVSIGYAADNNGLVYECELNMRSELTAQTKFNKNFILKLLKDSPDEYAWTDWDEDQNKAYQVAYNQYTSTYGKDMYEILMQIWYDFYRNYPTEFVRHLTSIGLDGTYHDVSADENGMLVYAVVYNPGIIKVLNVYTADEAKAKLATQ